MSHSVIHKRRRIYNIYNSNTIQYYKKTNFDINQQQYSIIYNTINTINPANAEHNNITEQHTPSLWHKLSYNTIKHVLCYLTSTELINIRQINTQLRTLIFDINVWQHAVAHETNTTQGLYWYLLLTNKQTTTIKLYIPTWSIKQYNILNYIDVDNIQHIILYANTNDILAIFMIDLTNKHKLRNLQQVSLHCNNNIHTK